MTRGLDIANSCGFTLHEHHFGTSSLRHSEGVMPELMEVAELAIKICFYDGTIINGGGLRTYEQALANTQKSPPTGILNSLHRKQSDESGHAIDLIALTPGKGIDWSNITAFKAMGVAVKNAAAILNVPIRQGNDWDMDGIVGEKGEWDWAHFEYPEPENMDDALAEMRLTQLSLGLTDRPTDPAPAPDELDTTIGLDPPSNPPSSARGVTLDDLWGLLQRQGASQDLTLHEVKKIVLRQMDIEKNIKSIRDGQKDFISRSEYDADIRKIHERLDNLKAQSAD